eukprot:gnl/TRDRNA2_/TRDRNA2_58698_c0_seq1.p1 gnl/TRDRNA2_/TRDRNA2_58698_c0~~gnl/TRDRNA2_/TRDRNA2_58698_c0_seq1.p1  ORF type:complete len:255 (+),score=27.19 gnl/TRDRNA2_/TRDRNA2_58698_c0_seq1:51-815(+)
MSLRPRPAGIGGEHHPAEAQEYVAFGAGLSTQTWLEQKLSEAQATGRSNPLNGSYALRSKGWNPDGPLILKLGSKDTRPKTQAIGATRPTDADSLAARSPSPWAWCMPRTGHAPMMPHQKNDSDGIAHMMTAHVGLARPLSSPSLLGTDTTNFSLRAFSSPDGSYSPLPKSRREMHGVLEDILVEKYKLPSTSNDIYGGCIVDKEPVSDMHHQRSALRTSSSIWDKGSTVLCGPGKPVMWKKNPGSIPSRGIIA